MYSVIDKNAIIGRMDFPFVVVGYSNNDAEMIEAAEIGIGYGGVCDVAPAVMASASHIIYQENILVNFLEKSYKEKDW